MTFSLARFSTHANLVRIGAVQGDVVRDLSGAGIERLEAVLEALVADHHDAHHGDDVDDHPEERVDAVHVSILVMLLAQSG